MNRAEWYKGRLEEGQRERRRVLEEEEAEWVPAWFVRVNEDVWPVQKELKTAS